MIYLIYGHQLPVIKKTLKNLIKTCLGDIPQDDFNVEKLSSRMVLVQDIVYACSSIPLGSDKKVVVVTEPYYLSSEKEKCSLDKDQDYDMLIKYLNNPSANTDLIFFLEAKDINSKSEIYKVLTKVAKIMPQDVLTEDMLRNLGQSIFVKKGTKIKPDALNELVNRCGDDVSKFTSEATKLSLYKDEITIDDVKLMVSPKLEDNAFLIVEALIKNKINEALKIYYDLRINKQEPVVLIYLIAAQLRFMLQVGYLSKQNLSLDQIASELKSKPFRIRKNLETLTFINMNKLRNIIDDLYNLDVDIKSGNKDPYYAFELFLINFNSAEK